MQLPRNTIVLLMCRFRWTAQSRVESFSPRHAPPGRGVDHQMVVRQQLARIDAPRHLVRRYGTEAAAVWALREQAAWLGEPVVPGRPTIGAELLHGVLAEGALTPEDLIERRTRLSLVDADVPAAREAAQRALDLAAQG
mgnify:CR=1 FL=1